MKSPFHFTRRQFLYGGALLAGLASLWRFTTGFGLEIPGTIVGANSSLGHRLRHGGFPSPSESIETDIVIVGGGMAGLSAAWKLQKSGIENYQLLELDHEVGGNSRSGHSEVSAYPWGAHYVPLLTDEARAVHELFKELGIITGYHDGKPIYSEYYLCADPHERLYIFGRWQEGLVPQLGLQEADHADLRAFFTAMDDYKHLQGRDGKRAFTIPIAYSSADEDIRELDRISMADYLMQNGWHSSALRWYVDYCCRDDYGAPCDQVSAWAGIHYFAARNGQAANADPQTVLTWPEGNGWIVRALRERLRGALRTQALVFRIKTEKDTALVHYYDQTRDQTIVVKARTVIVATPHFVAERLYEGFRDDRDRHYGPWAVANITLDAMPEGKGAALAWDNVVYKSPMLGYVVATHQSLARMPQKTILTYYWPLSHKPPQAARAEAFSRTYPEWRSSVLRELFRIHPELRDQVRRLDVWLWGHGMICPSPGYIWDKQRQRDHAREGPIFRAHSDVSGISIFEEAHYQGVRAAEQVMGYLRHPYETSL